MEIQAFRVSDSATPCWWVSIFTAYYTCIFRGNITAPGVTSAIRLALDHIDANPRDRSPGVEDLQAKE